MKPADLQALIANILRANSFLCVEDEVGDLIITKVPASKSALNVTAFARELAPYLDRSLNMRKP